MVSLSVDYIPPSAKSLERFLFGLDKGIPSTQIYRLSSSSSSMGFMSFDETTRTLVLLNLDIILLQTGVSKCIPVNHFTVKTKILHGLIWLQGNDDAQQDRTCCQKRSPPSHFIPACQSRWQHTNVPFGTGKNLHMTPGATTNF